MRGGKYSDAELEELEQFAGEIISNDLPYLQQWSDRQGYTAELPPEVILAAATQVIVQDDFAVTQMMRRQIDELLLIFAGTP